MHSAPIDGGHPRRWAVLAVLVVSLLIVVLDNSVLNVALRVIADPREGLGATQGELQWSINSYTLVFAALLFTWGVVGDRRGRKLTLMIGFVLFGFASVASAYAQDPTQLILARAAMGIGGAAVMPSTLAIISNVFDPAERAKAIGIWAGAVGLGIAIGPITGGLLLERFWWGSVFLINVPIVVLGLVAIFFIVPESRNPQPGRLDPIGVLLQISGLVLVVFGIIRIGDVGSFTDPLALTSFALGLVIVACFILFEARSDHPALDVSLFRQPTFSAAVGTIGLTFFALMGVTFFMVFYLQVVRGYTPLKSGVLLLPLAGAQLLISPQSARLAQRFGIRNVCASGLGLVGLAFISFLLLEQHSSLWVLEVIFALQGAGMAMVMPPATNAIMGSLPRERAGIGSSVNNTVRQVGGALGVAVLGTVLSASYRNRIRPTLDRATALSAQARDVAVKSIQDTDAVIRAAQGRADALRAPADAAFIHAMHLTAGIAAFITLVGVAVCLRWLPGRAPAPVAGSSSRTAQDATV